MGNNTIITRSFIVKQTPFLKLVIALYLFLAIILTVSNINIINEVLIDNNYAKLKQLAYNGELETNTSPIFLIARIYIASLWPAILLYGFYIAKNSNVSYYKYIFYILAGLIPSFVTNILYTYRGGIGIQVLLIISCFLMMRKYYSSQRKKQFYLTFAIIFSIFISILISITVSRFGESSANDSLVDYFGQSILNYNGGIASRIDSYARGRYFFGSFLGLDRNDVCNDSLYGIISNNGSNLNTFVGNLVLDFGFIGGFFLAVIFSILLCKLLKNKRSYDFADSSLLMFYLNFIYSGAFHSSFGFAKNCLYFFIIYIFIKYFNKKYISYEN